MNDTTINRLNRRFTICLLVVVVVGTFAGCRVGPDFQRPAVNYFDSDWSDSYHPRLQGEPVDLSHWWNTFQDPTLDYLVHQALSENLDLKEAGKRIQEARALRRVVAGNLYPQSQTANAGFAQTRISENSANFFSFPGVFSPDLTPASWSAGVAASWELDFWGQYRRAIEVADAKVDVSVGAADLAKVLLLGELASTYIEMRTLESRLQLASRNQEIQANTLTLIQRKLDAGVATELDRHQAESNLAQTQATVPALEIARRQACHRICVLIGRPAVDLTDEFGWTGQIPSPPPSVAAGIPMDLLRRRPDIRIAEKELAAQSAQIGIAQADFYPRISLTGSIGMEAEDLSRLFQSSSIVGLAGPQVSWKVLNYGRLQARVEAERAALEQRCAAYHRTVLSAHQEAQDAQVAFCLGFDQVESLSKAVQHAHSAVEIAQKAYDDGGTDFNRVYLLQSDLVRQQDALAATQGQLAKSLVALFVAMGGGWESNACFSSSMVVSAPPQYSAPVWEPRGNDRGVPAPPTALPTALPPTPEKAPTFDPIDQMSQLTALMPATATRGAGDDQIEFRQLPSTATRSEHSILK